MTDMTATEPLTTGWEHDVPGGDTLLRRYLFAWVDQCEAIVGAAGGVTVRGPGWALADLGRPAGLFNAATLLAPLDGPDDERLGAIEGRLERGVGEAHLWSAWPTPDLRRRGWELVGHPPLLVRPPARDVGVPEAPPVPLRAVRSAVDLAEWERVFVDGYPIPELQPARPGGRPSRAPRRSPLPVRRRRRGRPSGPGHGPEPTHPTHLTHPIRPTHPTRPQEDP
jgi:hypothetical protein